MEQTKPLKLEVEKFHITPVMVESPYSGDIMFNVKYARLCMADSYCKGEAPFLGHLLYTQISKEMKMEFVADDDYEAIVKGRDYGLACNRTWRKLVNVSVFYVDLGWSQGMLEAKEEAIALGHTIYERNLENWEVLKTNLI